MAEKESEWLSIVLWGNDAYCKEMEEIRKGLALLQKARFVCSADISICTGKFESYYGKEFASAELLFVYFQTAGEEFCRFLIAHRRYTEKTIFLFGQSYGCFDANKMSGYYRLSKEEYLQITEPGDYFYEAGLKELLCLIEKKRSFLSCAQAG